MIHLINLNKVLGFFFLKFFLSPPTVFSYIEFGSLGWQDHELQYINSAEVLDKASSIYRRTVALKTAVAVHKMLYTCSITGNKLSPKTKIYVSPLISSSTTLNAPQYCMSFPSITLHLPLKMTLFQSASTVL